MRAGLNTPGSVKGPVRTCLGCRQRVLQGLLLRFALDAEGKVCVDLSGRLGGRHAYCCRDRGCWRKFCKNAKGLSKAFRRQVAGFDEELCNLFGSG